MDKTNQEKNKFIDVNGKDWPDQMGDLKVGSKFILYGTELCVVKSIEEGVGPAGVVYLWKDKEYYGLPPIRVRSAWCEEKS